VTGNNNTLPNFIKARSAKLLRASMLKNNARLNMSFIPYQIIHDGKSWYAWYNEPIGKALETAVKEG
jgi:hypothetical protein